jgi:hypothetical protein
MERLCGITVLLADGDLLIDGLFPVKRVNVGGGKCAPLMSVLGTKPTYAQRGRRSGIPDTVAKRF